jgi:hypothetical protein
MTKFVIAVLAAVTLVQPALSVAGDKPTDSCAKPSSFVPHHHTNHHVYGAPIGPAIVGHRTTPHHEHAPKKQSSSAAMRSKLTDTTHPQDSHLLAEYHDATHA